MLVFNVAGITYRQERVDCGRACGSCPHGPYWYAYQRINGRLDKRYVGIELPEDVERVAPLNVQAAILVERRDRLSSRGCGTPPAGKKGR